MTRIAETEAETFETSPAETARIVHNGGVWVAAGVLAPGIVLGPLLAAGWRPGALPPFAEVVFWIGAAIASIGLALLIWAGCPVLGFPLEQAHRQKVDSIRFGIPLNVAGMAIAGFMLLLSPA